MLEKSLRVITDKIKIATIIFMAIVFALVGCKNNILAENRINDESKVSENANGYGDFKQVDVIGYNMDSNNDIYNFKLSEDDLKKIADINKNQRYANW